jgi:hypothetical protein
MAPAAAIEPAAFFAPELADGPFGRAGDAKNRITAAAPTSFEAPAPPPAIIMAPAAQGQSNAWSMPQLGRITPRTASPNEEISAPPSDSFEMPVNQQSGK